MDHRAIRFIGSIRLAVPLLTIIVGVLIWATFYEAQVGSATVQQTVYKSPWFGALMFLLALNLGVSALSRYPWRGARKIGFALTHLGLIVIIAGSAAVIHLGVEGMLPLRTDSGMNNQIRSEGDLLEVMTPDGKIERTELWIKPDGTVAQTVAGLNVLGYSENTIKTVSFTEGTVKNLAVRLSLNSDRMGHLERWLAVAPVVYSKVPIGPAELEIIEVEEIDQQLSPPETNQSPWGTLQITTQGRNATTIDVQKKLSQTVKLDDLSITLVNFWSDFRLDANRQPYNASETFNNPAVQLEVSSPQGTERWFIFSDNPPVRTQVSGAIAGVDIQYQVQKALTPYFRVIATPRELYYAAQSSRGFKSGALKPGDSVTPGWADFQITLEEVIPHAQLNRQVVPVDDAAGSPALLVEVADKKVWLPWGEPTAINTSEGEMFAAFSPKLLQLPFAIALEDFIVERNEGSESVAMWTSKIRIHDPQRGITQTRNVWMNHPTWYQGWKIAQASWNPGDLQQSTLQVKREPAWVTALTWTGSALIVFGIGVMFYGPALTKRAKPNAATPAPQLETESAEELAISR